MKKLFLSIMAVAMGLAVAKAEVKGDVNCDGVTNSADVTALYNYILKGVDTHVATGDVNGDGVINSSDVTMVYNILLNGIKPQPEFIDFEVNGTAFRMILVEGGTMMMGSDANASEQPVHQVTLTTFYIAETECTQALWKALFPSYSNFATQGDLKPCNGQQYGEVLEFVDALNSHLHATGALDADMNFMLPTEAQWEWAARGGVKSQGYTYAGSNNINDVAWYWNNSDNLVHDVKLKAPNELGLYDMSGNAHEVTTDNFSMDYSWAADGEVDPSGSPTVSAYGLTRRGGSCSSSAARCTVTKRDFNDIEVNGGASEDVSFRLILK
jgi:formylglycine-generating enzyme required for sulfatase activity